MILGLDISTSITGITVIDSNNNILLCEHLDTRNKNKFPSLLQKAGFIRENLREIKDKYEIETIFVEERRGCKKSC